MKRTKITWERNRFSHPNSAAGWYAKLDGDLVGIVFADGDVSRGGAGAELTSMGSPHLAALALVRYVEAGGR